MRKSKEDCPAQERPDCEYCLDTGRYVNDFSGTVGQPCAYCLKGEGECRADGGRAPAKPLTQRKTEMDGAEG